MGRTRQLKPEFFVDEDLANCSRDARLCFAGLWTLADREGRLEDRPKRIKAQIFPYDDLDTEPLLAELAEHRFIVRYEAGGRKLIAIRTFAKHQRCHVRENASELPAPPDLGSARPDLGSARHNLGSAQASPRCPDSTSTSNTESESTSEEPKGSFVAKATAAASYPLDAELEFLQAWNSAKGCTPVKPINGRLMLTDARRKHFRVRIRDPVWDWRAALAKFPLQTVVAQPEGWKPDMDWFLKPDSVTKILEGKYDWTPNGNSKQLGGIDPRALE